MVDGRKRLHREVMESLAGDSPACSRTAIPAASDVERMGSERAPIAAFAARSRAGVAYEALWAEIRERLGLDRPTVSPPS